MLHLFLAVCYRGPCGTSGCCRWRRGRVTAAALNATASANNPLRRRCCWGAAAVTTTVMARNVTVSANRLLLYGGMRVNPAARIQMEQERNTESQWGPLCLSLPPLSALE